MPAPLAITLELAARALQAALSRAKRVPLKVANLWRRGNVLLEIINAVRPAAQQLPAARGVRALFRPPRGLGSAALTRLDKKSNKF